jgi:hypothetical protein
VFHRKRMQQYPSQVPTNSVVQNGNQQVDT